MKKQYGKAVLALVLSVLIFSCTGLPPEVPEKPLLKPEPPEHIMGQGLVSADKLALFLEESNPRAGSDFVRNLASLYIEEAAAEGVNHDAAFAQMCLETGFLRYGGLVTADMNNFCGLGSIGPGQKGETFFDARTGVRAHIQHLKAYASETPLNRELVDPRYRWVKKGSAPAIADLAGKWATDREYGNKIGVILDRLYGAAFNL